MDWLWNGTWGGPLVRVNTTADEAIFAFIREKNENRVFTVFNLSSQSQQFSLQGGTFAGTYRDVLTSAEVEFQAGATLALGPWEYGLYSQP